MTITFLPGWLRIVPVLVVVTLLLTGSAVSAPAPAAAVLSGTVARWSPVKVALAAPKPERIQLPAGALGRLTIASISVDAVARRVGLNAAGAMDTTPNIWEVGVFDQAVQPGEHGNAVIEGHLDWTTGPAVFWNLRNVGTGSEIDFTSADGTMHRFAVSRVRNVPYNSPIPDDLMTRSGTPSITLITCSGRWISAAHSYSTRLLLTATAIPS